MSPFLPGWVARKSPEWKFLMGKSLGKNHGNIPANWSFSSLGKAAEMEKPPLEASRLDRRASSYTT